MKIRVKFTKHGPVRYVGHLDMMRYFQKALRRAGTDVSYSEGYSPHPIMSFASPLGVGMESDAEYFDLQVESSLSSEEEAARLNRQMADGIQVVSWRLLPEHAKKAMAQTAAIAYGISLQEGHPLPCEKGEWKKKMEEFLGQEQILVLKKTKKNEVETDIRSLVFSADASAADEGGEVFARLCSESGNSLNVKLFLEAFCNFCGRPYDMLSYRVCRKEVYYKQEQEDGNSIYLPLEEYGEPIEGDTL